MEFGICSGPEIAEAARAAGFTFIDAMFGDLLKPAASQAEFEDAYASRYASSALPVRNTNCLLPGGYCVAGPQADIPKAAAYCATGLARAGRIGVKTVCFGSGAARNCPDGWPLEQALRQIRDFVAAIAPAARDAGIKLVVENLRAAETNTLNMLADIGALLDDLGDPDVGMLVDIYHWTLNGDSARQIVKNGARIFHTHVSTIANRRAPGEEIGEYAPFAAALAQANYRGNMAIEGGIADKSEPALRKAFEILSAAFK